MPVSNKTPKKVIKEQTAAGADRVIFIKGAREHNLRNIDVSLPKNQLIVVTGVSGSGKSSLTIDTLYAEGQRRYVESLSSYARQFLMRLNKPDVDYIRGICPAIALDQKTTTRTTRSTVGTLTEIYDYMRLLYARIGVTVSPKSGEVVRKHRVTDVVDYFAAMEAGKKAFIAVAIERQKGKPIRETLSILQQKGFTRLLVDDEMVKIETLLDGEMPGPKKSLLLLVDRLVTKGNDEEQLQRVADSADAAFYEGHGELMVLEEGREAVSFSNRFEADGMVFEEPSPDFFNQNNPYGACRRCEGFGSIIGVDPALVIPDTSLSLYQGAIACWRGEKMKTWLDRLVATASNFDLPVHKPFFQLTPEQQELVWTGNEYFEGLHAFFHMLEENAYKIQYRVMLARYRGRTLCPECKGSRIRQDAAYVKVGGKDIGALLELPIDRLQTFFNELELNPYDEKVARRILVEIQSRLSYMLDLGLNYLNLNRRSNTLSGGETQRINLTRTLGSNLTSSLYILDEPSVGLHPRDTERLVRVLKELRNLGNTVVVVEHEEEVIKNADYLLDIGPLAGVHGGKLVYAGPYADICKEKESLTARYLNGDEVIPIPVNKRKPRKFLMLEAAEKHNLKRINVRIPLHCLSVVAGVSGSGKTTLIKHLLYPELQRMLDHDADNPAVSRLISGDWKSITQVEMVTQDPIGKSSRSNPVTYVKAYDAIRDLYAAQPAAKAKSFKPSHFSFNVDGGRCETCKGDGEIVVDMQFLADVHLVCDECGGKRFKEEVLDVTYLDKNISDVLSMSIEEAVGFFAKEKDIVYKLQPLLDVGLGYVQLGQSSSTLSGGEAQRVKLASFLGKGRSKDHVLFIFDEPTTGLHFHDIRKLLDALQMLIENGHSILVIEHNLEVIKCADWVTDLGPEGGEEGGYLVYEGAPEGLAAVANSYTGKFLKEKL
jgi:excinuclease ABC subunit A